MGEKNAYLVECPRMYGSKKVVLAPTLQEVVAFLGEEMKRFGMEGCRIESIVLIGEVLN